MQSYAGLPSFISGSHETFALRSSCRRRLFRSSFTGDMWTRLPPQAKHPDGSVRRRVRPRWFRHLVGFPTVSVTGLPLSRAISIGVFKA